ncbi:MAG TPA: hypothetical protein DDW52_26675, partial [Planctomycetaceae bacterium]|nr:hypothetical protein [Planctomycetaceae bacterium]
DLAEALDGGLVQDWKLDDDYPAFLQNQLDLGRLQIGNIAFATIPDDFFHAGRKNCDVWQMSARSRNAGFQHTFYVAKTACPPLVKPLPRNFKPLSSSGGWSVAALEAGSNLYVLMTDRSVEKLLRHQQLA